MKWKMKEIVLVVVLSIVCGIVYLGWSTLYLPLSALLGPITSSLMFGIWIIASPITALIIQKPGVALISEIIAASVEVFTGSHFGLSSLLIGIFQGLGAELAFALFAYKKFSTFTVMLSGALAGVGSIIYQMISSGWSYFTPQMFATATVVTIVSGAVLGGLLGQLVVLALKKTGSLNGYAVAKNKEVK
ncbi:ABC transporter ATP-binding protein [Listeria aquatica]|uniref:ABC transporter ATP-binding protein n=1 Tax=Listeria aquatica TaxID=1494960 RepID=A0A841ZKM8_9LIST|nr:ECF transporter S component [Listeria aquatica]MBC1520082.1 ABC transporter ATP-binding protein [Listeria aquatica]